MLFDLPPSTWRFCAASVDLDAARGLRVLWGSRAEVIDGFSWLESDIDAAESKRECVISTPPDAGAGFFRASAAGFAPRLSLFEEGTTVNGGGMGAGPSCAGGAGRELVLEAAEVAVEDEGFDVAA